MRARAPYLLEEARTLQRHLARHVTQHHRRLVEQPHDVGAGLVCAVGKE